MKLQCSCGAKYELEPTPEMAQHPIQFVCPSCGLDSSAFVNQLIRQQLGLPPAAPAAPKPAVSLRTHTDAVVPAEPAAATPEGPLHCPKHPHEIAHEKCHVCSK